jgi:hypothetical protein
VSPTFRIQSTAKLFGRLKGFHMVLFLQDRLGNFPPRASWLQSRD